MVLAQEQPEKLHNETESYVSYANTSDSNYSISLPCGLSVGDLPGERAGPNDAGPENQIRYDLELANFE